MSIACSISSLSTHWVSKKEAHELALILILISTDGVTVHLTLSCAKPADRSMGNELEIIAALFKPGVSHLVTMHVTTFQRHPRFV